MKKNIVIVFLLLLSSLTNKLFCDFEFTFDPIDVVIPCHSKDQRTIDLVVEGVHNNVKNLGRIFVVSASKLTDKAEWFDERNYPFTKEGIAYAIFKNPVESEQLIKHPQSRLGWIYQQLLKSYAILTIPNISSNVLILDADTIFLSPVEFQDPTTGAGLYCPSAEDWAPYFRHNERVLPGWKKIFHQYSGIAHHMLLQKSVMEQMFADIRKAHNGKEPWVVFCEAIDKKEIPKSCMCVEYELYFNYVFSKTNLVKIRQLKWGNIPLNEFDSLKNSGYHFLSCHTYLD